MLAYPNDKMKSQPAPLTPPGNIQTISKSNQPTTARINIWGGRCHEYLHSSEAEGRTRVGILTVPLNHHYNCGQDLTLQETRLCPKSHQGSK